MFTWNTPAASIVTWLVASVLVLAPGAALGQEMDFGDEEDDVGASDAADVELDEEQLEPEEPPEAEPEAPEGTAAYAFAMTRDEQLAGIARELDSALRDVLAGDTRFSTTNGDNLLNGLSADDTEALEQAREIYRNGRSAYLELELEQAYELFEQALQAYEDQVAHVGDLNLYSDCLLFMGAAEVLAGRARQAATTFTRLLIIDPERRPDPNMFPPPVVEAFGYASGRMDRTPEGVLEVTSTPEGADLFVDGVFQGPTPQALTGLKAGRHYIRVRRQGYVEAGRVIEVNARRPTQVALTLEPTDDGQAIAELVAQLGGEISERSEQAGATVQRLGAELGIDVLLTAVVVPGDAGVTVQINVWDATRGRSIARQLAGPFEADPIMVAGDTPPVAQNALTAAWSALSVPQVADEPLPPPPEPPPELPPEPSRPFYRQWWFWTVVGAVVVGAGLGVGLGVGLSNQEPGETAGEVIFDL